MMRLLLPAVLVSTLLTLAIACSPTTPAHPSPTQMPSIPESELAQKYRLAGEGLASRRFPNRSWGDRSNWSDGVSHSLPALPLEPDTRIWSGGMTCAQWEALDIAVFPEGEDIMRWHLEPHADAIEEWWEANLAMVVWGEEEHPQAIAWAKRENFTTSCGSLMK